MFFFFIAIKAANLHVKAGEAKTIGSKTQNDNYIFN